MSSPPVSCWIAPPDHRGPVAAAAAALSPFPPQEPRGPLSPSIHGEGQPHTPTGAGWTPHPPLWPPSRGVCGTTGQVPRAGPWPCLEECPGGSELCEGGHVWWRYGAAIARPDPCRHNGILLRDRRTTPTFIYSRQHNQCVQGKPANEGPPTVAQQILNTTQPAPHAGKEQAGPLIPSSLYHHARLLRHQHLQAEEVILVDGHDGRLQCLPSFLAASLLHLPRCHGQEETLEESTDTRKVFAESHTHQSQAEKR